MIDLGSQRGPIHIIETTTSVDCTKDVRFRRSFRSLVECMVPCCCPFQPSPVPSDEDSDSSSIHSTTTTITGTFFGYRRGRVSFCFHDDSRTSPLLLLDFAIPTAQLAREMRHGLLRIALECTTAVAGGRRRASLFSVPVWTMYCNGRRVGYAVKRNMNDADAVVFKLMHKVSVGAGVLPGKPDGDGELMYLRASFERVVGSLDSESFHMINPVGSSGQELSIFLLRS
ncbi:putative protein MIZU-KUSSEI 1-like, plant [Dioscorea sansibarensis]